MADTFGIPEQLAYSTVRILCQTKTGATKTGTGFFFDFLRTDTDRSPALVTNRHVVQDAASCEFLLTQASAEDRPLIGRMLRIDVPKGESAWVPHPDPDVDLCILPVTDMVENITAGGHRFFLRSFDANTIPSEGRLKEMAAMDPVVMIGYPVGIWDDKNNMPIFRRGIAATHPYLNYQGRSEFVIDMACFPGSSGSPVLFVRSGLYSDKMGRNIVGQEVKLLGVLYAGPQYTAEGGIVAAPAPTQMGPSTFANIPINLGYVINAQRLLEFEPGIQQRIEQRKSLLEPATGSWIASR